MRGPKPGIWLREHSSKVDVARLVGKGNPLRPLWSMVCTKVAVAFKNQYAVKGLHCLCRNVPEQSKSHIRRRISICSSPTIANAHPAIEG